MFDSDGRFVATIAEGTTTFMFPGVSVTDRDVTAAFKAVTYDIVGGTAQTNNWIDIDDNVSMYIYM